MTIQLDIKNPRIHQIAIENFEEILAFTGEYASVINVCKYWHEVFQLGSTVSLILSSWRENPRIQRLLPRSTSPTGNIAGIAPDLMRELRRNFTFVKKHYLTPRITLHKGFPTLDLTDFLDRVIAKQKMVSMA